MPEVKIKQLGAIELHQEINPERLIINLVSNEDNICVISGLHGSEKSKSLLKKLKAFDKTLQVDNIDPNHISDFYPDIKHSTRILLDDDQFQEEHFTKLCRANSDKIIYWIKLKDSSDNASPFMLQQIYNPNFGVERQFNHLKKVIIEERIYENWPNDVAAQLIGDILLFTGVDNQDAFLKLFPEKYRNSIQQNMQGNLIQV